jgi:hypothetical protein
MPNNRHPGINMHKLSFGDGFAGLVFTLGTALIFLFGLPALWYFVALAFALGIGIAVFLRLINGNRSERNKPLSILTASQETTLPAGAKKKQRQLFQIYPRIASA